MDFLFYSRIHSWCQLTSIHRASGKSYFCLLFLRLVLNLNIVFDFSVGCCCWQWLKEKVEEEATRRRRQQQRPPCSGRLQREKTARGRQTCSSSSYLRQRWRKLVASVHGMFVVGIIGDGKMLFFPKSCKKTKSRKGATGSRQKSPAAGGIGLATLFSLTTCLFHPCGKIFSDFLETIIFICQKMLCVFVQICPILLAMNCVHVYLS